MSESKPSLSGERVLTARGKSRLRVVLDHRPNFSEPILVDGQVVYATTAKKDKAQPGAWRVRYVEEKMPVVCWECAGRVSGEYVDPDRYGKVVEGWGGGDRYLVGPCGEGEGPLECFLCGD